MGGALGELTDVGGRGGDVAAVLVDLDGVIRGWPEPVPAPAGEGGPALADIARVAFSPALLDPAIRGEIDDAEWRRRIEAELARTHSVSDAARAVAAWSRPCGEIDVDALGLVASRTASRARLVLATNATSRLDSDLAALGVADRFDAVARSSALGCVKPEPEYFRRALGIAGADADRALFVDDAADNVAAAAALGIRSHHFVDVRGLDAFLSAHGLDGG